MATNIHSNRTTTFNWETRQELYEYFETKYSVDRERVDEEINRVMRSFRPRKGKSIKTQELWQKVGNDLERLVKGFGSNDQFSNANEATKLDLPVVDGSDSFQFDKKDPESPDTDVLFLEEVKKSKKKF